MRRTASARTTAARLTGAVCGLLLGVAVAPGAAGMPGPPRSELSAIVECHGHLDQESVVATAERAIIGRHRDLVGLAADEEFWDGLREQHAASAERDEDDFWRAVRAGSLHESDDRLGRFLAAQGLPGVQGLERSMTMSRRWAAVHADIERTHRSGVALGGAPLSFEVAATAVAYERLRAVDDLVDRYRDVAAPAGLSGSHRAASPVCDLLLEARTYVEENLAPLPVPQGLRRAVIAPRAAFGAR